MLFFFLIVHHQSLYFLLNYSIFFIFLSYTVAAIMQFSSIQNNKGIILSYFISCIYCTVIFTVMFFELQMCSFPTWHRINKIYLFHSIIVAFLFIEFFFTVTTQLSAVTLCTSSLSSVPLVSMSCLSAVHKKNT